MKSPDASDRASQAPVRDPRAAASTAANEACASVEVPSHAFLNSSGHGWQCDRGYQRSDQLCVVVLIPADGYLSSSGDRWECERGFRRNGQSCVEFAVPRNAHIDYSENEWTCNPGYRTLNRYSDGLETRYWTIPLDDGDVQIAGQHHRLAEVGVRGCVYRADAGVDRPETELLLQLSLDRHLEPRSTSPFVRKTRGSALSLPAHNETGQAPAGRPGARA